MLARSLAAAVWVYCEDPHLCGEDYKDCWLKHKAQPLGANVAPRGPSVGWTTGVMVPPDYSQDKPVRGRARWAGGRGRKLRGGTRCSLARGVREGACARLGCQKARA